MLPPDDHVHSEWSWDAVLGSMTGTCARAVELGLPSVAFTEHADFTPWTVDVDRVEPADAERWRDDLQGDVFRPPAPDLPGYLDCLQQCRERFPQLRIRSGVELSEPHWFPEPARQLIRRIQPERILASVHSRPAGAGYLEIGDAFREHSAAEVITGYLAEVARRTEQFDDFEVLAHIDYPVRHWPADLPPFDPLDFEPAFRTALAALADGGRVLELNTRVPLAPAVLRWWYLAGGQAISFGSDAHQPADLARGFAEAAELAQACGFRPDRDPHQLWLRD